MKSADLKEIAVAIAKANGHPAPEHFAARVVAAHEDKPMPADPSDEKAPE